MLIEGVTSVRLPVDDNAKTAKSVCNTCLARSNEP